MSSTIELSVVVPCYNEEESLPEMVACLSRALRSIDIPFEILLVDDGSRDRTFEVAVDLARGNPENNIRIVSFSRNFGHQIAVSAGLDHARGKAVVLIDADLQDPPEVIGEMVEKWREGYEVVYGQRRTREGETWFKITTANFFYRTIRWLTDRNVPENTGDFRLMDRKVVDQIKAMKEKHRFIRGIVSWVGFRQTPVFYDRKSRFAGKTKYPLKKMLLFAIDAVTSFSVFPLRFISILGMVIISLSILFSLTLIFVKIFMPDYFIPGFPTLAILILFFGGVQLFALGIIGEYLGRVYEEAKGRPLYIVKSYFDPTIID